MPLDKTLSAPIAGEANTVEASEPKDSRGTVRIVGLVGSWGLLLLLAVLVLYQTLNFDFRTQPLIGDQASHLLQAVSLAGEDHNLSFDARDLEAWRDIGWTENPGGLFFQAHGDGWAFAKPYGYSVYLSSFVSLLGPVRGVAVGNSVLIVTLMALCVGILWTRFGNSPAVPLGVAAFCLASYVYLHGFAIHTDLLLACLVAAFWLLVLIWQKGTAQPAGFRMRVGRRTVRLPAWLPGIAAFALAGFLLTEKLPFVCLLLPVLAWMLVRVRSWRLRFAAATVLATMFVLASTPYLYYSDGASYNPYGGDRWYSRTDVPFSDTAETDSFIPVDGTKYFSGNYIADALTSDPSVRVQSLAYYVIGAHTGMLVFIPVALLFFVMVVAHRRSHTALVSTILLGITGYILFNVILFPENYYGGGQSLGNRYFLQAAPTVLALVAASKLLERSVVVVSIVGLVLGAIFLWPHHRSPQDALGRLDRTSWLQSRLPVECNQMWSIYFTGSDECPRDAR